MIDNITTLDYVGPVVLALLIMALRWRFLRWFRRSGRYDRTYDRLTGRKYWN